MPFFVLLLFVPATYPNFGISEDAIRPTLGIVIFTSLKVTTLVDLTMTELWS